jgi:hypothetical protein
MPKCTGLDLDDALDLLNEPMEGRASFPFGLEVLAGPVASESGAEPIAAAAEPARPPRRYQ